MACKNGACTCMKSAKKSMTPLTATMFSNGNGANYSLGAVTRVLSRIYMLNDFSVKEEDGELVIHTGLFKKNESGSCTEACDANGSCRCA